MNRFLVVALEVILSYDSYTLTSNNICARIMISGVQKEDGSSQERLFEGPGSVQSEPRVEGTGNPCIISFFWYAGRSSLCVVFYIQVS